jgi:hypothetical protein
MDDARPGSGIHQQLCVMVDWANVALNALWIAYLHHPAAFSYHRWLFAGEPPAG